jgi:hypothetical protein
LTTFAILISNNKGFLIILPSKIEKMFIEPEVAGDPFEVSDIDTMLNYINVDAVAPKSATMFSRINALIIPINCL